MRAGTGGTLALVLTACPNMVFAQNEVPLPTEPMAPIVASVAGAGTALEGLGFEEVNPASLMPGVWLATAQGVSDDRNIAISASVRLFGVTAGAFGRTRQWDDLGASLGVEDLSAHESIIGAAVALHPIDQLAVGAAAAVADAEYFGHSVGGWLVSTGFRLQLLERLSLGAAVLNAGDHSTDHPMPARARGGAAFRILDGETAVDLAADLARSIGVEPRQTEQHGAIRLTHHSSAFILGAAMGVRAVRGPHDTTILASTGLSVQYAGIALSAAYVVEPDGLPSRLHLGAGYSWSR